MKHEKGLRFTAESTIDALLVEVNRAQKQLIGKIEQSAGLSFSQLQLTEPFDHPH